MLSCGGGSLGRPTAVPSAGFDPLAGPAERKHRLGFVASQSEIKDIKVVSHVSAVCCASKRQHPELDSETKYYLRNRLVVVTGDLGHAWFQENLAISGK